MKTKNKSSKLWYLALIAIFAVGWIAGGVVNSMTAPVPFEVVDNTEPVVTGDTADLAPVEITEPIQEIVEVIEEVKDDVPDKVEEDCVPDADGFERCDWGPEYADFPYSIPERASPGDWIKQHEIAMAPRSVTIQVQGAILAAFADTNSMDPVFDSNSNAIEIVPKSYNQIVVGDMVSYATDGYGTMIHRVIETGHDDEGWYAVFQGDNNPIPDPGKVRWEQIRRVIVAIIY